MYTSDVRDNVNLLEYGKFVRLDNDVRFPAISVTRVAPNSTDLNPITALDVYPKYGVITYIANASDISGGGSTTITNVTATISNPVTAVRSNTVTNWDILSASLTQNTATALAANPAHQITISNDTGYTLYISRGAGIPLPLLNNNAIQLDLIANTNEVTIKQIGSTQALTAYGVYVKY
jgi:hypothetical protein